MPAVTSLPEVVVTVHADEWEAWYNKLPEKYRDINFTFSYHDMFRANGDGEPVLFVYREGNNWYYYPFLKRKILNSETLTGYSDTETVYGYTGPLVISEDGSFVHRAMKAYESWCSTYQIISGFIRFHPLLQNQEMVKQENNLEVVRLREYVYVNLSLPEEKIQERYTPQNRNKIRKALKAGIQFSEDKEGRYFDEFRRLYLENMKQVGAARMYFFSDLFFEKLNKLLISSGALLVATREERVLAAAAFLWGNEYGHYFLASAGPEGKKQAAGNLLLHEGILLAKRKGLNRMHLGGGVSSSPDDPLLVFKKNFSQDTTGFYIGKQIHDRKTYDALIVEWNKKHPDVAEKYAGILQRYHWEKEDLL